MTKNETQESVINELQDILDITKTNAGISIPSHKGKSWKGLEFEQNAYFPTWILDKEHVLTKTGLRTIESITGRTSESSFWSFSTNGVVTAGHFEIPTIGFAPGKEELAHSCKEELLLDDLLIAAQFYGLFPFQLCDNVSK